MFLTDALNEAILITSELARKGLFKLTEGHLGLNRC